jgi:patatin-like phospholipase/acyl hydrolase
MSDNSFKILSIDGGGIRGLIPAKVLAQLEDDLEKEFPGKKLYEHFDLICGTSTGSILAIAIALGIPSKDLVDFYKLYASEIFPKWYLKIFPRKGRAIINSIYSSKQLQKRLREVYSAANGGVDPLLNDLRVNVCIPTFNGNTGEINVLKTKHHKDYTRDYKLPAYEVALSSSSAPIYFPPHSFQFENKFGKGNNINMIDGGIFANNPALIGLLEASEKLDIDFANIKLLSIGTGSGKHIIKRTWRPKDIWYWLLPTPRLLDIILDSQAQITEQYIQFFNRVLGKNGASFQYERIQYDFGSDNINLNDSSKKVLERLESIGEELGKKNYSKIKKIISG